MEYTRLNEQYSIDKNDGSGPFPEDVDSILISYDPESKKPIKATMTATCREDIIDHVGPEMRTEKDPSKLVEIVNYFHKE